MRDEIISFVRNSTEEVNSQLAIFISGMQAQKNLEKSCRGADNYLHLAGGGDMSCRKLNMVKK